MGNLTLYVTNGSTANNTYTLPPEAFTKATQDEGCQFRFYNCDDNDSTYLGMWFLEAFVATFDYENNTIDLAVNVNAPAGTCAIGPDPTPSPTTESVIPIWVYAVIGACVFLLIFLAVFCACRRR